MIIAIASGKGGTGKTTVSVNLASVFPSPVHLLDCDVEAPNAHLYLNGMRTRQDVIATRVPGVEESLCNGCGECSRVCEYHAIASFGATPVFFHELCHSCGGCMTVCPQKAIRETDRRIGVVEIARSENVILVQGRLDVGVAMAPPLIRAVRSRLPRGATAIIDAPPGTSCPVVTAVREADCVVLVAEPTPFGLHDLTLAATTMRMLRLPVGVVINRVGIGDDRVNAFCSKQELPVLLEIPDDLRVAEACSRGELAVDTVPEYRERMTALMNRLMTIRTGKSHEVVHADI